jgi:plasmid maintenance system antidote protein VapI
MARDDLHFRLRIPDELKTRIEEAARANKRSMTGEIIARLEETFDRDNEVQAKLQSLKVQQEEQNRLLDAMQKRFDEVEEAIKLRGS